ncbi:global cell cycle regulator GcrA-like protein [Parvularcula sp. ZS-1/3]|uniref:Global cell cycle regulator GcrA-like protein n=1 Tax=Parvularcula mediterranea TaxID=2732508 RepID=A0A7Y3RMS9_9PROT|nr:GcrA family cell cycle regulator [Parvularcula mediterranea]NNU16485.1 global cell cycle regulator GcrA-like protein [Parvularcula mediterranea]
MAWTEERVEELKKLWSEGHSASQIAARMGGVTRNAVIGKVHRLGLSGRAAPAKPKTVTTEVREAVATAAPERERRAPVRSVLRDLPPIGDFGSDRLTVSSIGTDQCKWPIGDPASEDFHFCGQSAGGGKPYCAYHAQLAFQPSTSRSARKERTAPALPRPIRAVS